MLNNAHKISFNCFQHLIIIILILPPHFTSCFLFPKHVFQFAFAILFASTSNSVFKKTYYPKAPGVWLGGSGVSIGGVRSLRVTYNFRDVFSQIHVLKGEGCPPYHLSNPRQKNRVVWGGLFVGAMEFGKPKRFFSVNLGGKHNVWGGKDGP